MTAKRGTSNRNARGNTNDRRARREWLVKTFRADMDAVTIWHYAQPKPPPTHLGMGDPACRCYRCGILLTVDTVTVDRIIPGCRGGTYQRNNIRPACGGCNSETGGTLSKHASRKRTAP